MPYIEQSRRIDLYCAAVPASCGELNFVITALIDNYIHNKGGKLTYADINEIMGVLESAKQEFYRRVAVPYEDGKLNANGDVFCWVSE